MWADSIRMDLWTFCEMGCKLQAYGCSFAQLGEFLLIYYFLILTGLPKDWFSSSLICKYTTIYLLSKGPHDLCCQDLIQSSRLPILTAFLSLLYHRSFSILFTHFFTPENQKWFINTILIYAKAMYSSPAQAKFWTWAGTVCYLHGDEPPHQIRSYTLLFSLFLHFPHIANPPLHTSTPTQPHAIALARQSHSLYWTELAYLMDIWLTIHMYLLLFLVSPMCPLLWSDQSQGLTPCGQALSIASPYARILVYHSYLTCLYLPFTTQHHYRSLNQFPIWVSPRIEISHLRFTLISHYFTLFRITSHCHDPTVSTCHNTPGDNPIPPDRTPSEPHRIYS